MQPDRGLSGLRQARLVRFYFVDCFIAGFGLKMCDMLILEIALGIVLAMFLLAVLFGWTIPGCFFLLCEACMNPFSTFVLLAGIAALIIMVWEPVHLRCGAPAIIG
jgi:hypothetical protein